MGTLEKYEELNNAYKITSKNDWKVRGDVK